MSESGNLPAQNAVASMPSAADIRTAVAGRDVQCPGCGYNLRDLESDRCPECARPITLPIEPSVGAILRRLGPAAILAVVAAVMPALGGILLIYFADTVGTWLRSLELSGVLFYAGAFALLAGLALLPTYAQSFLGGWAFAFAAAFPAALGGFFGGSWIGYELARRASGDRVERLIEEKPTWLAVRNALVGRGFWGTLGIVALLRLPPNSPFAFTNLVMASVQVARLPFLLGTLVGMAPRTAAAVAIGDLARGMAAKNALKQGPEWWVYAVGIGVMLAVLLVVGAIAKRAIEKVTAGPPAAPTP